MRVEGSTLRVETGSSSWVGPSDCGFEIRINLHKGAAISIDQPAVQAQMTGDYTSIALEAMRATFHSMVMPRMSM